MATTTTITSWASRMSTRWRDIEWPAGPFYGWAGLTFISGIVIIGCCAYALEIQNQLTFEVIWLLPFGVAAGTIAAVFALAAIVILSAATLYPGITMIISCILFALFLTGLIGTAVQLFGPVGSVSSDCQTYILSQPIKGLSIATLAWLQQRGLCNSWYTAFAFWLLGTVLQPWMMMMSVQMSKKRYDSETNGGSIRRTTVTSETDYTPTYSSHSHSPTYTYSRPSSVRRPRHMSHPPGHSTVTATTTTYPARY